MRNVAVGEGAIALHKLLAEYQPDIVNRHLGLLMTTMNWTIRATDPITAISELDLRITAHELQSSEKMADTAKTWKVAQKIGTPRLRSETCDERFGKTEFLCANGT